MANSSVLLQHEVDRGAFKITKFNTYTQVTPEKLRSVTQRVQVGVP